MPNYQLLSSSAHRALRVAPYPSMHFAARTTTVPLYVAELSLASKTMPMAFMQADGKYSLVGLLGLGLEENRFVLPDGRWNGDYIPANLRLGPFALAHDEQGQATIAIDVANELVGELHGEVLFDLLGEPTTYLKSMMTFLKDLDKSQALTEEVVFVLAKADVLVPWNIELSEPGQEKQIMSGLFKVDESKLNALSDEAFLTLRHGGCMPVIYAHLLSISNLQKLYGMAKPVAGSVFVGLERDGLLHFGGL